MAFDLKTVLLSSISLLGKKKKTNLPELDDGEEVWGLRLLNSVIGTKNAQENRETLKDLQYFEQKKKQRLYRCIQSLLQRKG